jgi:metal-dependent hydrolase (beta-lactamase superfamily II)
VSHGHSDHNMGLPALLEAMADAMSVERAARGVVLVGTPSALAPAELAQRKPTLHKVHPNKFKYDIQVCPWGVIGAGFDIVSDNLTSRLPTKLAPEHACDEPASTGVKPMGEIPWCYGTIGCTCLVTKAVGMQLLHLVSVCAKTWSVMY